MSDVVSLQTGKTPSTAELLEVLDSMRRDVEAGRIVAFAAVGLTAGDGTLMYSGSVGSVTRLRMGGAVGRLATKWNAEQA